MVPLLLQRRAESLAGEARRSGPGIGSEFFQQSAQPGAGSCNQGGEALARRSVDDDMTQRKRVLFLEEDSGARTDPSIRRCVTAGPLCPLREEKSTRGESCLPLSLLLGRPGRPRRGMRRPGERPLQ